RRLDLLDRDRLAVGARAHQAAQGEPLLFAVDAVAEGLVELRPVAVLGPRRVLQQGHRLRVPAVLLALAAPGVEPPAPHPPSLPGRAGSGAPPRWFARPSTRLPPSREWVPRNQLSMNLRSSPTASKDCEPR